MIVGDAQKSVNEPSKVANPSVRGVWISIAVVAGIASLFFTLAFANLGPTTNGAVLVATPRQNLATIRCKKRFEAAGTRVDSLSAALDRDDAAITRTRRSTRRISAKIDRLFPSQTLSQSEYARYLPYKNKLDRAISENSDAVDMYNSTLRALKKAQRRLNRLGKIDC